MTIIFALGRNLSSLLELLAGLANGAAAAYVAELLQVNLGKHRICPNSPGGVNVARPIQLEIYRFSCGFGFQEDKFGFLETCV